MELGIAFVVLFAIATGVSIASRRLQVPYTVALVIVGLFLGAVHLFEPPHLTKDLLYALFLPGLLFEAAYHLEFSRFWQNKITITSLAIPGLIAAIGLTAAILAPATGALRVAEGFTYLHALVFASLIAATDPIAVVGLFKSMGAPKRLAVLVEGESLLNDGTAVVLFTLVLVLAGGGDLTLGDAFGRFLVVAGMGVAIGAVIGLAVSWLMSHINEPMVEITLTTIAAYGSFIGAEHFHFSGVIATVVAGMLCGNYAAKKSMSASTRVAVESFWEYVAFALNSLIFLLIGFEVRLEELAANWLPIIMAYAAVMVARAVVIFLASLLLRRTNEKVSWAWTSVLVWGGLRGALSMVLVLGLALDFPHRDLLITMTFGVVVLSILVQGLTMAPLLKRLGVVSPREAYEAYERHRGLARAANAALDRLAVLERERTVRPAIVAELRGDYEARASAADEAITALHLEQVDLREEELRATQRLLVTVEKEALKADYHHGDMSAVVYEALTSEVDARLLELHAPHGVPDDQDDQDI